MFVVIGCCASLSAYHLTVISFALQFAVKFDVPVYVSNVELLHVALFAFDVIPDEYEGVDINITDKKLSNKLHVCVCVCV